MNESNVSSSSEELSLKEVQLYDRQLRLWGLEGQQKINSARVLIVGLTAIHVELAKNLALAGFSISLIDDSPISYQDLEHNFFLSVSDLNATETKADVTAARLQDMNPLVKVKSLNIKFENYLSETSSLEELLRGFTVICISIEKHALFTLIPLDTKCRDMGLALFASICCGKYSFFFTDLSKHTVMETSEKGSQGGAGGITLDYPPLEQTMKTEMREYRPKIDHCFYVFFALFKWKMLEEKRNDSMLPEDFVTFTKQLLTKENCKVLINNELIKDIGRMHNKQFLPTASITGGYLAQEIRKFVSNQQLPFVNCFIFNMNTSSACIARIP